MKIEEFSHFAQKQGPTIIGYVRRRVGEWINYASFFAAAGIVSLVAYRLAWALYEAFPGLHTAEHPAAFGELPHHYGILITSQIFFLWFLGVGKTENVRLRQVAGPLTAALFFQMLFSAAYYSIHVGFERYPLSILPVAWAVGLPLVLLSWLIQRAVACRIASLSAVVQQWRSDRADLLKRVRDRVVLVEIGAAAIGLTALLYFLRSMLLGGDATITHDNIVWGYPIFQYFAEGVLRGHLPLWNPFTHGGEPFYTLLPHFRLFDPNTFLVVRIGSLFTHDLLILFHWDRVVRIILGAFGTYLVLRSFTNYIAVRLSLIPILLFSSFMTGSFQQDAFMNQFIWVPYIVFFLLRIVHQGDLRWRNWLGLAAFLGLNWQSLFFVGSWVTLLFFSFGLLLFRRDLVSRLIHQRQVYIRAAVLAAIVFLTAIPSAILFLSQKGYVFPPRMLDVEYQGRPPLGGPIQYESTSSVIKQPLVLPYSYLAYTGSFSTMWDFIQLVSPDGSRIARPGGNGWGSPSEAFIYVGLAVWAIAVLGLVLGKHDLKSVWTIVGGGFALLMLGPSGGLHRLLYYVYPPLWFVRHTHSFVLFFVFVALYFYVIGANELVDDFSEMFSFSQKHRRLMKPASGAAVLLGTAIAFGLVYLSSYAFVLIPFGSCVLWMMRRILGSMGLLLVIIGSYLTAVLLLSTNRVEFVVRTSVFLFIPILVLSLIALLSRRKIYNVPAPLVFVPVLLFTTADVLYCFVDYSRLYHGIRPDNFLFYNPSAQNTTPFPKERRPYPPAIDNSVYGENIRYLSLLYREPHLVEGIIEKHPKAAEVMLGPNADPSAAGVPGTVQYVLANRRWSTFFLPMNYFRLINTHLPTDIIEAIFAIKQPLLQFKTKAVVLDDDRALNQLADMGSEAGPEFLKNTVILAQSVSDPALRRSEFAKEEHPWTYEVVEYTYDSLNLKISTDAAGFIYWADGYDPSWHAFLNSTEIPVIRANLNFKAVAVPSGQSEIRFVYSPSSFLNSLWLFYGTLGVCFIGLCVSRLSTALA